MHDNMTVTLNKPGGTHQTAPMTQSGMVPLDSPVTAHTMYTASLGLTGHGWVQHRERVERRRPVCQKGLTLVAMEAV